MKRFLEVQQSEQNITILIFFFRIFAYEIFKREPLFETIFNVRFQHLRTFQWKYS